MEIDNFNLVESLLCPESDNDFWFGQVIARRKDIPNLPRSDKWIKSYYLKNYDHLKSKEEEIKSFCNMFHARFYLSLNVKNFERVNLALIKALIENLESKQYNACINKLDSVCGYTKTPNRQKYWIVDLDGNEVSEASKFIDLANSCNPKGVKYVCTIPTLNGSHLIFKPFNLQEFKKINTTSINSDDIKKNSPTLIYYND